MSVSNGFDGDNLDQSRLGVWVFYSRDGGGSPTGWIASDALCVYDRWSPGPRAHLDWAERRRGGVR